MLAARDQENLAYAHQQAAASKPLNQAPKTPAPNGPLASRRTTKKALRDDENDAYPYTDRKPQVGKGKAALFTPAPRDRAPLGAKTTNAKAKPLQTPAPLPTARQGLTRTQRPSASARKPRLRVHQQPDDSHVADAVAKRGDDSDCESVPDVEHCPSKATPLPDYPDPDDPDEIKPDECFPQFAPENYFRGVWDVYARKGEDGLTNAQRRAREQDARDEQYLEAQSKQAAVMLKLDIEREWEQAEDAAASRSHPKSPPLGRALSRSSEACPSARPRTATAATKDSHARPTARFAQPTAATRARQPAAQPVSVPKQRMTPGTVASMNTIGYGRGRKVSTTLKEARDSRVLSQHKGEELLDELCRQELHEADPTKALFEGHLGVKFEPFTESEFENFQLDIPPDA